MIYISNTPFECKGRTLSAATRELTNPDRSALSNKLKPQSIGRLPSDESHLPPTVDKSAHPLSPLFQPSHATHQNLGFFVLITMRSTPQSFQDFVSWCRRRPHGSSVTRMKTKACCGPFAHELSDAPRHAHRGRRSVREFGVRGQAVPFEPNAKSLPCCLSVRRTTSFGDGGQRASSTPRLADN